MYLKFLDSQVAYTLSILEGLLCEQVAKAHYHNMLNTVRALARIKEM